MSKRLEAYLIIGCGGLETMNGFLLCNSISTPILDFEELEEDKYERIITFMDHTCKMFDRPTYDYNKVVNIITMLFRTYQVIEEDRLIEIQRYLKMHRDCGIFLILLTKEDFHGRQ
jgi:hypothetical protein